MSERSNSYTIKDIQVLKGLEAVRRRPSMYIGSTDARGLHHLIFEIVYNSVDEFLGSFGNLIQVFLLKDYRVRVRDNGRGIPVEVHPDTGVSGVETVFAYLHAGAKFGGKAYTISGGLHGVGASVVNALSSKFEVEVRREGKVYRQEYRRGKPIGPLSEVKVRSFQDKFSTGTTVTFLPDKAIFHELEYDFETIAQRLKELAYLNPGLRLELIDEISGKNTSFCFDSGIVGLVKEICQGKSLLHSEPIYLCGEVDRTKIEVALQYVEDEEQGYSFVNCINTYEGGSHLSGFRTGLTRAINEFAHKNKWLKDDCKLQGEDVREGLNFVLSVYLPEPQFEGQVKARLSNQEVKSRVEAVVFNKLLAWLEEHPVEARGIVEKCLESARTREAARREREARRRSVEPFILPGKLADCSDKDPENRELFIVEGESAGGSAKNARDRHFQAILPLKGKILNVEKASVDKILKHKELQAIKLALRVDNNDLSRLRYNKVVIMTDADVDGSHIRTLLLTFFYRQMPELIRKGHLHIAQPPLYRLQLGNEVYWAYSEEEKEAYLKKFVGKKVEIQRYKGLGEMSPEQLWQTTLNPKSRVLLKVEIKDAEEAERLFRLLMGEEVPPRRQFIQEQADKVRNLDI